MKIIVIGCGGGSVEALIALVELAKEHEYTVIVDSGRASMATMVQQLPEPEVFEITRNMVKDLPEIFIEPDVTPFSKFRESSYNHKNINKRNHNIRRR